MTELNLVGNVNFKHEFASIFDACFGMERDPNVDMDAHAILINNVEKSLLRILEKSPSGSITIEDVTYSFQRNPGTDKYELIVHVNTMTHGIRNKYPLENNSEHVDRLVLSTERFNAALSDSLKQNWIDKLMSLNKVDKIVIDKITAVHTICIYALTILRLSSNLKKIKSFETNIGTFSLGELMENGSYDVVFKPSGK